MDYDPNQLYEWNGQIASGSQLANTEDWLFEYCDRIERALAAMNVPRTITGGRKYQDGQARFDVDEPFGDSAEYVMLVLNKAMIRHGKRCTVEGKSLFVTNLSRHERIQTILHKMEWVETKAGNGKG